VAQTISDSRLLRAHSYWREKSAGRPFPDRRDIDPVEIPDLLPFIVLWDVLPEGGVVDEDDNWQSTLIA
jgi:hypothetical protein